jgi:hypothetical protein
MRLRVRLWHRVLRFVERRQDNAYDRLVDREQRS